MYLAQALRAVAPVLGRINQHSEYSTIVKKNWHHNAGSGIEVLTKKPCEHEITSLISLLTITMKTSSYWCLNFIATKKLGS